MVKETVTDRGPRSSWKPLGQQAPSSLLSSMITAVIFPDQKSESHNNNERGTVPLGPVNFECLPVFFNLENKKINEFRNE